MSDTTIPKTGLDIAVANNTGAAGFVETLRKTDPALAQQIEGTSAAGSRTLWIMVATPVVSWVSVHYLAKNGLALDPDTANLVSGLLAAALTSAAGVIMRLVTRTPITSVLPQPATAPPNVPSAPVTETHA